MTGGHAGAKTAYARDRRRGQQDRTNRLGADGARRVLQSSSCGGLSPPEQEASEEAKVNERYGATVRRRGRENQGNVHAPRARESGVDPIRDLHTGQQP